MMLKLQPDQVALFWDLIRKGTISAYSIPKKFQQDFAIGYLKSLLSGLYQAWVYFEDESRKIIAIMCTRIIDEREHGVRTLALIGLYGLRLISEEAVDEALETLEKFAKANGCSVIITEYSSKRVESMLLTRGYEKHITVARKPLT